jgi:hypothetical protein
MRAAFLACILVVGIPLSQAVAAFFENGNSLLEYCSAAEADDLREMKFASCYGYIIGAIDMMEVTNDARRGAKPPLKPLFCLPTNVTRGQLVDTVKKYLTDNPAHRHYSAAGIVLQAIDEAFPC